MRVVQMAGADPGGFLLFSTSPKNAPVLHFNGPLHMGLQPGQKLSAGEKPKPLR